MFAKIATLVAKVNEGATNPNARWTYDGATPFADASAAAMGDSVPHVQRFRLGNGLRLLLLVDRTAPVVSYFTWFRVGSRHEKPGKTGLAHLFEHLMFNEAEGLKAGEFDRKLEENGAESNAATWLDWTYYYESLPRDRFALAVKLESQRMAKLVLREPQIVSEKEVVANERRMRVDDDIEGFTPDDCVAFYKTFYAPNNATIVVVGDVDTARLLRLVRQRYGAIPRQTMPTALTPSSVTNSASVSLSGTGFIG